MGANPPGSSARRSGSGSPSREPIAAVRSRGPGGSNGALAIRASAETRNARRKSPILAAPVLAIEPSPEEPGQGLALEEAAPADGPPAQGVRARGERFLSCHGAAVRDSPRTTLPAAGRAVHEFPLGERGP